MQEPEPRGENRTLEIAEEGTIICLSVPYFNYALYETYYHLPNPTKLLVINSLG